jgi:hypothetical protein
MAYTVKNSTIRIDLSHLGEDDNGNPFFIEMKNPRFLSYEAKMAWATAVDTDDNGKIIRSLDNFKNLGAVAQKFITAWNLIDMETGELVLLSDEGAINKVPAEAIEAVFAQMGKTSDKQEKEIKNS